MCLLEVRMQTTLAYYLWQFHIYLAGALAKQWIMSQNVCQDCVVL